ncbi:tripartite tricarboxylate transporter permease [Sphaerochaeta sp. PS]|uniref:tripartite tricarboxylate transporter permease n=1 Tax=Sphaerochaeta sp. PS TaxID=3076336 RepID=UPI0028A4E831|nr:tripartite tricarboxylate transporter permease [Sphaerochaeta sp. PS]MDT4763001.1 tripartite tricarboxylate transporter permease [Sphaerochaeta sp. PS]
MENLTMLLGGFSVVLTMQNILVTLLGAVLGLIVGAMPGIGSLAGVALLLPLTYKFNPTTAIIMLGSLYYANMYGGAFSAILLNIPGDSPAVMTALDGYPMATKRNRPGQALFTSNMSSFIGGLIGMFILTFTGPALANLGLKFGPAEMTALLLVAMTSIGWLVGENPIKGVLLTLVGILIASMGMDTLTGSPRFDFGNMYLLGGIPFTPFVIGTVGFSQVLKLMGERNKKVEANLSQKLTIRGSMLTLHDIKRLLPPAIRSGFLGTFVGVLPGAGATTGSFMGYAMQKAFKSEEELGSGAIEGIAACEAANNAAAAGSFAPLLALGIPGSGTGAVLLGGLMMWGLNPGPLLFTNQPEFCWGLIASLFLANLLTLVIALGIIPFLIKILTVPIKILIPCITVICIVGSYSTSNSMYGVLVMFFSGLFGYILDKNGYSTAPMLLAFVLAPLLESNMRKSFISSHGSLDIFFRKPISAFLILVLFAIILTPVIKFVIRKVRSSTKSV